MDESEMYDLLNEYSEHPVAGIMDLIANYAERHPLATECGSEYIYQNDKAQTDALRLVADIFDLYSEQ